MSHGGGKAISNLVNIVKRTNSDDKFLYANDLQTVQVFKSLCLM